MLTADGGPLMALIWKDAKAIPPEKPKPSLDEVAQQVAAAAISAAERAGYETLPDRGVFFRSDMMEFEGEILHWLINHMRPVPPPRP